MTGSLSEHQRHALDLYIELLSHHPDMFAGRQRRPIIQDPQALETFTRERRVTLGVLAETPYLWLINDLVESETDGGATVIHPYLRIIAPPGATAPPGVVVVATTSAANDPAAESIILVQQERHALGTVELELPRGFGTPGIPADAQALQELQQETGYIGGEPVYLGTTLTDTGTTDRSASFFHVPVTSHGAARPEPQEAITRIAFLTREEIWQRVDSGEVRDAFTIQAIALYERHLASRRSQGELTGHT